MGTLPYYALFAAIGLAAALSANARVDRIVWFMAYVVFTVFVGLRHHVGMDWNNYLLMTDRIGGGSLMDGFRFAEPGFVIVTWLSDRLGLGIYGANFAVGAIFCAGLLRLCRRTDSPWLGLVVAFPVLMVVVSMSATRQAAAIGVLMWLLADWSNYTLKRRITIILLASTFHASAAMFFCLAVLDVKIAFRWRLILVVLLAILTFQYIVLMGGMDRYVSTYVTDQTDLVQSTGALQHVMLNAVPALMLLGGAAVRNRLFSTEVLRRLAVLAIMMLPLVFIASAAAGRVSLYMYPVSIYVFANLPSLIASETMRRFCRLCIVILMFVVLYVWLNYANSAGPHSNYQNLLFLHPSERHL
jgi:hypothetical protein